MRISVVVPVLDEAPTLAATLVTLASLRTAGHEVIVVDGGSRDGTPAIATPLADRLLLAPRGRAAQLNTGASVATGEILLFLHADCRLPARAVESMARALARGSAWGRFDVLLGPGTPGLALVGAFMNWRSSLTGICTGDQGIFVERAVFEGVGGFPPLPLMEDVALSKVLRRRAGAPARIRDRMKVSARRWVAQGLWRTIALMWRLRFRFWRGADSRDLARRYLGRDAGAAPVLLVFAKPLVSGKVKTRLAATLGEASALQAYRKLLARTLATAAAAKRAGVVSDVELWAAPDAPPGELRAMCEQRGFTLCIQHGDDLGERMHDALRRALAHGNGALLIGTDVPNYDVAYLAQAAWALQQHDAVFGPAEDGGYVLAGLARDLPVFEDVAWSTPDVMARTRDRLRALGAKWHQLPTLWDVDTHADFVRWIEVEESGGATARGLKTASAVD